MGWEDVAYCMRSAILSRQRTKANGRALLAVPINDPAFPKFLHGLWQEQAFVKPARLVRRVCSRHLPR